MIKFVFRWGFRFFILLIVLVVGLLLLKNSLAKSALEARLTKATGMETRIGAMEVGIFSPIVRIENCRIYNTAEFGGSPFLDIPELHMEIDREALFYRELDIKLLRFNLAEANFVQNQQGAYNIQAIQKQAEQNRAQRKNKSKKSGSDDDDFKFLGIGTLNLTLGKVRDIDLRQPQRQREYDLNLQNQVFRNLKTMDDIFTNVAPVLMKHGVAAAFAAPPPSPLTNAAPVRPGTAAR